jgi:lipopolysaccharide export system protein LptA
MRAYLFYPVLMMLSSCALLLYSQQSKIIELRSADRMEGKVINDEDVRELIGKVHFVQIATEGGLVKVWCDRALRFMKQNKIELHGNVKIIRDSVTIRAKEGMYYGDQRKMEGSQGVQLVRGKSVLTAINGEYFVDENRSHFTNNVVLVDTSSIITCHEMYYFEKEARSIAIGNVHVFETINTVHIFGDSLIHSEQQKATFIFKQPRLVRIDTSALGVIDTMVVVSRVMQSFQDTTDRFIAIDNVRMVKADMSARCGKAIFYIKNDVIDMQIHPILWSEENQVTGDSIRIRMREKRLESLWVKHHSMIISQADTTLPNRFNQLTGRELTMYFHVNKLQQVDVQKNATSLYYLYDNNEPNGVNKSSGDRILIDFIEGQVDQIKVVGGVQGRYFPEKMILNREPEYNLDGFRLYTNRPKRLGSFIINE